MVTYLWVSHNFIKRAYTYNYNYYIPIVNALCYVKNFKTILLNLSLN